MRSLHSVGLVKVARAATWCGQVSNALLALPVRLRGVKPHPRQGEGLAMIEGMCFALPGMVLL
jgi:hypothetical protein